MTLGEMKKKYLGLIEELNPKSEQLTDDPDIAAKQNETVNQVMFELARMKKIPKYLEMEVSKGGIVTFEDIGKECGYDVYQIKIAHGVDYEPKADGTVLKFLGDGTAEIEIYVYPKRISEDTKDEAYAFELSPDALEVMPYGIAADLLKSDVSAEYGRIYADRYREMVSQLDPRYQMNYITIEGGVSI